MGAESISGESPMQKSDQKADSHVVGCILKHEYYVISTGLNGKANGGKLGG